MEEWIEFSRGRKKLNGVNNFSVYCKNISNEVVSNMDNTGIRFYPIEAILDALT
ncbi:hypothetical protein D3C83_176490 [compost metagenome]